MTSFGARFRMCLCRIVKTQTCDPCSVILHPPKTATAKADAIPPPLKPPTNPSPADPKGLAAPPAPPKAEPHGVPAPKFPPKAKAKAKSKAKSISDEEKAKIPRIFHRNPNGCMHGSNCKYSHEDPKNGSILKGRRKGKEPPPKGKGGPLAKAMVALVAAASLCKPFAGSLLSGLRTPLQVGISVPIKHCWSKGFLPLRSSPAYVRRIVLLPSALEEGHNLAFKRFP